MILSSGGCKVSWGPAGPAPPLSLCDISPAIGGICPSGERGMRHLRVPLGGLQVGYKLQIRPRTTVISKKIFSNHRRPSPERRSKFSLRLVHDELCGFHRGDGGCVGCVTIVSMVTIFLTPGVSLKYRHDRHHRHGEGWMRRRETILPE